MKYYFTRNVKTNECSKSYFKSEEKARKTIINEDTEVEYFECDGIANLALYKDIINQAYGGK